MTRKRRITRGINYCPNCWRNRPCGRRANFFGVMTYDADGERKMHLMRFLLFALLAATSITAGAAHGDVRLAGVFGDHMVLQQRAPLPVWGWADPGERVTV